MTDRDTKTRILDASEALFSEHGYAGASMREITKLADVNLAAINYHFGSKEALLQEVFQRSFGHLNEERLRRLDALERLAGGGVLDLEDLVRAFIAPGLEFALDEERSGADFLRFIGRVHSSTGAHWKRLRQGSVFKDIRRRFGPAFARALPQLEPTEINWRLHFVLGATIHAMLHPESITPVEGGAEPEGVQPEALLEYLVPFLAAGLRAPTAVPAGETS